MNTKNCFNPARLAVDFRKALTVPWRESITNANLWILLISIHAFALCSGCADSSQKGSSKIASTVISAEWVLDIDTGKNMVLIEFRNNQDHVWEIDPESLSHQNDAIQIIDETNNEGIMARGQIVRDLETLKVPPNSELACVFRIDPDSYFDSLEEGKIYSVNFLKHQVHALFFEVAEGNVSPSSAPNGWDGRLDPVGYR